MKIEQVKNFIARTGSWNFYDELEMQSKFVDVHYDTSTSSDSIQIHSHTFYELIYCKNGNIDYLIGTDRYHIQKGDILLIAPGTSHGPLLSAHMNDTYERIVLWVSLHLIQKLCEEYPVNTETYETLTKHNILRTSNPRWDSLADYFEKIYRESRQQLPAKNLLLSGYTATLLALIQRALLTTVQPESEKDNLFDKIIQYVEFHYPEKISLQNVADYFFINKSTISKLFQQRMGIGFYNYVIQRRLIASKNYILEGYPLHEIAEMVGFSNYSSFYRAFKQEYGISPQVFQKMKNNE